MSLVPVGWNRIRCDCERWVCFQLASFYLNFEHLRQWLKDVITRYLVVKELPHTAKTKESYLGSNCSKACTAKYIDR